MEIERYREECMTCLMNKYLNRFPETATKEQVDSFQLEAANIISSASKTTSAPVVVRDLIRLHENVFGPSMDYFAIKRHYNQLMLDYQKEIREKLLDSKEPLKLGIQYALTGNYIDFAALKNVEENYLLSLLKNVEKQFTVDETEYRNVKNDLLSARRLVYLTDNCGEIVLDGLFLEVIERMNSGVDITVVVRGGKVFNDATLEDAQQIGLTEQFRVIDNGNRIAGTWLPECSDISREAIDRADVIIAKGQANFETLRFCGKNIYYIFLCKCDLFAESFGVPKLSGMLLHDRRMKRF